MGTKLSEGFQSLRHPPWKRPQVFSRVTSLRMHSKISTVFHSSWWFQTIWKILVNLIFFLPEVLQIRWIGGPIGQTCSGWVHFNRDFQKNTCCQFPEFHVIREVQDPGLANLSQIEAGPVDPPRATPGRRRSRGEWCSGVVPSCVGRRMQPWSYCPVSTWSFLCLRQRLPPKSSKPLGMECPAHPSCSFRLLNIKPGALPGVREGLQVPTAAGAQCSLKHP